MALHEVLLVDGDPVGRALIATAFDTYQPQARLHTAVDGLDALAPICIT